MKDEGGRMRKEILRLFFHPSSFLLHPCSWCPRKDSNLQPLVCRTSAPSIELLGRKASKVAGPMSKVFGRRWTLDNSTLDARWWSELESNQPFGLFRPALIRLSYPTQDIADCRFSIADLLNALGMRHFNRQ